jgi:hypothetical protein
LLLAGYWLCCDQRGATRALNRLENGLRINGLVAGPRRPADAWGVTVGLGALPDAGVDPTSLRALVIANVRTSANTAAISVTVTALRWGRRRTCMPFTSKLISGSQLLQ